MTTRFFSFGLGREYRDFFVEIVDNDPGACRDTMVAAHGLRWSMEYDPMKFAEVHAKYPTAKLAVIRDGVAEKPESDAPQFVWLASGWTCSICGYTHSQSSEPPDICPQHHEHGERSSR